MTSSSIRALTVYRLVYTGVASGHALPLPCIVILPVLTLSSSSASSVTSTIHRFLCSPNDVPVGYRWANRCTTGTYQKVAFIAKQACVLSCYVTSKTISEIVSCCREPSYGYSATAWFLQRSSEDAGVNEGRFRDIQSTTNVHALPVATDGPLLRHENHRIHVRLRRVITRF